MEFRKYQKIQRLGTGKVQDILTGRCYVFPKIDGTNASVWLDDDGVMQAGSRTRQLEPVKDRDNAGFCRDITQDEAVQKYLQAHPTHRLYGEWLVPHTLKTYRETAWRKFYVFDVCIDKGEDDVEYLPYEMYAPLLEEFGLEYIPPIKIINNPTVDKIYHCLDVNNFLVQDGKGSGEGVVVKNYDYYSHDGRQRWAKVVSSEFKASHTKTMGAPEVNTAEPVEAKIVNTYCTEAFIEKEYAKIVNDSGGVWNAKLIPRLLNSIYFELIDEEAWNFVKKFKNPVIDFRALQGLVTRRIKEVKSDIFN